MDHEEGQVFSGSSSDRKRGRSLRRSALLVFAAILAVPALADVYTVYITLTPKVAPLTVSAVVGLWDSSATGKAEAQTVLNAVSTTEILTLPVSLSAIDPTKTLGVVLLVIVPQISTTTTSLLGATQTLTITSSSTVAMSTTVSGSGGLTASLSAPLLDATASVSLGSLGIPAPALLAVGAMLVRKLKS